MFQGHVHVRCTRMNSKHETQTDLDFHIPGLEVQPDLQLEVLHNGGEYLHPVLLQGSKSMRRNRHSTKLWLPTLY